MHRQAADGEGRVQGAEAVDVVDHAEQDGRREGGVRREALQVVGDGDAGGRARVEAREPAVFERDVVVEAHEFHQHVSDEDHEVRDGAGLVAEGHRSGGGPWGAGAFGGGRGGRVGFVGGGGGERWGGAFAGHLWG